jgi:hypothetical protein
LKKALLSNDLPTDFVKWREITADQNQWRAVCDSKMPSATKETLVSSRQDIWAELRYGTALSQVQKLTRKFQMSNCNQQRIRKIHNFGTTEFKNLRSFS